MWGCHAHLHVYSTPHTQHLMFLGVRSPTHLICLHHPTVKVWSSTKCIQEWLQNQNKVHVWSLYLIILTRWFNFRGDNNSIHITSPCHSGCLQPARVLDLGVHASVVPWCPGSNPGMFQRCSHLFSSAPLLVAHADNLLQVEAHDLMDLKK